MKRVLAVSWTWTSSGWRSMRWRQAGFVPLARIWAWATVVEHGSRLPRSAVDDRHDDVARRPLLERADQLRSGRRRRSSAGRPGRRQTASNGSAQRREPDAHRALLPLGVRRVVRRASPESPCTWASTASRAWPVTTTTSSTPAPLSATRWRRISGTPCRRISGLADAAHAPALAGGEQHRPMRRRAVQAAALLVLASHVLSRSRTQSFDWPQMISK